MTLVGALSGSVGGRVDAILMLLADAVVILPGASVVLLLRGALPLVLGPGEGFGLIALLFAISGWPHVARSVRAIVATERARDHAEAARARARAPCVWPRSSYRPRAVFSASKCYCSCPQCSSPRRPCRFLGLGFPEPHASWGTLLQETANVNATAPWLLAPAVALFLVVLAVQLGPRPPALRRVT